MNPESKPPARPPLKERLKALTEEYGAVAIGVFIALWVLTLGGIYAAISLGWRPQSMAGTAGTLAATWGFSRLTLPLRFAATVVLTPLVARVLERLRLRRPRSRA